MSTLYRTTLAMCCLASLLPLGALAADAETPPAANAAPAAETPRPPLLERSQEDALALERLVPKAEQQTLQAGADSFLALWKPANDSDPQGAVIIVPGAGENADWPNAVGPLRQKFPDVGWHSLSISLPDLLADSPQARVEAKPKAATDQAQGERAPVKDVPADANANVAQATAADADTAESTDAELASEQSDPADAERIFARLDAAVAFAQQRNARSIVLIGHGSGAYWAARYLSEKQPPQVHKLVMVAAQTPARVEHDLESLAPTLKVPTADIYYATRSADRSAAALRLQASKRQKDSQYRQLSLIAMPGNQAAEQEQLFRRVRGWMNPQG
ncbi:alpha/beta hydrolase family protein [Pseudomonas juntendi]|jgi:pimeloyl-ACP methyl ester carboxylesterase|uniref:Alpha/beta hydrolase family protein n=1 Tax=Pseudomonas juntendi TaxID=2666183 RepID=A0A7W2JPM5_9PSED|nr:MULTISPECIES: alpha/beta hydrolase family protein [Pseudomonas]MBA6062877.1 alpha/beta hydrolase family protein [Pseudomonas juntendi]MBA6123755.1 alpha/beta hydrolase family protein [Pseudomonas juntendi]MBA6129734.1 alpha/beta hydrolase family protein [Pseudomonas juntendi]MBI6916119.1 alpha/beta hydrolase family protein [Pseudomonas juntendi]MBS6040256.1 alpha/beta hydrolase family protein [Pseudomonas sp.]